MFTNCEHRIVDKTLVATSTLKNARDDTQSAIPGNIDINLDGAIADYFDGLCHIMFRHIIVGSLYDTLEHRRISRVSI